MKKRILFHVAAVLQEVKMPYVIILLVVLAVIFGVIQTRQMHKAEANSDNGCNGGCSSCPHHNLCGYDEKK